jgi:hypothetical protein
LQPDASNYQISCSREIHQNTDYMLNIKSLIGIMTITVLLWSCSQPVSTNKEENPLVSNIAENMEEYPVRILNFHTTNRCKLCLTIEKLVKETVMIEYREQVEKGHLKLYVLNVDRSENRKTAEEYFAFGSALFVSSNLGENNLTSDLTNEAFLYAETDPDRFLETLRSTINQHLE